MFVSKLFGFALRWNWLQPGQSTILQHHNKISMNVNYPEEAVWKLADGKLAQLVAREHPLGVRGTVTKSSSLSV